MKIEDIEKAAQLKQELGRICDRLERIDDSFNTIEFNYGSRCVKLELSPTSIAAVQAICRSELESRKKVILAEIEKL